VSKKKNSPALFELISRDKAKGVDLFNVPQWMAGKVKAAPTQPAAAPTGEKPVTRPATAPVQPRPAEARPAPPPAVSRPAVPRPVAGRPATPRPAAEKAVAKQGQRLRVSLSQWHCIAIGVGLVVVLGCVFLLGKAVMSSATKGRQAAAAGEKPTVPAAMDFGDRRPQAAPTHAPPRTAERASPAATPAATAAPTPASEAVREKGKYYLIIQGTQGLTPQHRRDAEEIAAFLNNKGEPVTTNRYTGNPPQYIVLSLRGFDSPSSDEAKRYLKAIETLGRLYRDQGGKYNFSQGEDGWFVRW